MAAEVKKIYRVVIYPKDIQAFTGRSYSASAALFLKIRKALGKTKSQFVSVREFCEFAGIEEEIIKEMMCD